MNRDDASRDADDPRAPAGTWASLKPSAPGTEAASDPTEAGADVEAGNETFSAEEPRLLEHTKDGARALSVLNGHAESSAWSRRDGSGRARVVRGADESGDRDAAESHIRPRFLASELLRRRSESHEPIWPTTARVLALVGGTAAALLALGLARAQPLGMVVGALAIVGVLAAVAPMPARVRAAALGLCFGLTLTGGALLAGHTSEVLLCGAALAATSGAFLRARRFRSLGARGLFALAASLGVAGLVLDGGLAALSIESFALADLGPALRQLALGAALLFPLVTLVDAQGPSGALAVAFAWIIERLVDAAFHVAVEGHGTAAIGPLLGALVLPAAALGLAQATSAKPRKNRGR